MAGAFDRATGATPFKLPESWLAAKSKINPDQKFDFCTTRHYRRQFRLAGDQQTSRSRRLIFDGNIQSLAAISAMTVRSIARGGE